MASPELSAIIPAFGRPEQTAAAVRSALAQDVDLEVIVVDDGSQPPIAVEAPRTRVVRLPTNGGAAAARNAGASAAAAPWLAFLDCDDVWLPSTLATRLAAARAAPNADHMIWVAAFTDAHCDGRRVTRVPRATADLKDFASGCWMCPGSTALLSRAAWEHSGGQDVKLRRLEDWDWVFRWASRGGRLAVHPAPAAEITRGGRGRTDDVEAAVAYLRAKHADMPALVKRRMESYFHLERAVSRLHHGAPISGALALARSFALHPRVQPSLERFWASAEDA